MSRGRLKTKRPEGGTKSRKQEATPVRPKGMWQAGNNAVSRVIGQMQQSFGEDFSNVELDGSPQARQSAASLGAMAMTSGDTIQLGPAAPPLESERGQRLLAHELTHVVQQRRATTIEAQVVSPAADSFERTADRAARQAPYGHSVDVPPGGHAPGTQRQPAAGASDDELKKIKEDVQKRMPAVQPQPLDLQAEKENKIKKVDKDVALPGPLRTLKKTLSTTREDKGKKAPDPLQTPDTTGRRNAGKDADAAVGTVLFPQVPLHEIYYRTIGKQKPPRKSTEEQKPTPDASAEAKDKPDATTQALRNDVSGKLIQAMGHAQFMGLSIATLNLDASFEPQREAIAGQLDALFDEARDKLPLITQVSVSIGGKYLKTVRVPEKK